MSRARSTAVPRAVLDTNVVLSALVFGGGPTALVRQAWQAGRLQPLASTATAQELIRVLAYPKFKLTPEEREELLADYLPYGEVVSPWKSKPKVPVCRDEKDQIFLDLAAVGAAHWLVTGDRDLLDLGGQVRFQIIAPAKAIELLTSAEP